MIAVQLNQLELMEGWHEEDPANHWRAQFPTLGMSEMESLGTVYFELEPGQELGSHTDSQDEIVVLLSGSGEGTVGDETAHLAAHGMVFIPAMVPHGFRNTGDETLRAFGIFAGAEVVSTFQRDVMPMGTRVFDSRELSAIG